MRIEPRFSGLAFVNEYTQGKGLPKTTAYLGDYAAQGHADGAILVKTPSGKIKVMDPENELVAELTRSLRDGGNFQPTTEAPLPLGFRRRLAGLFTEVKANFQAGVWPKTDSPRGPKLYNDLFERTYQPGTQATEEILVGALGYNYGIRVPQPSARNQRLVIIDRDATVFPAKA